jgi:hypothetical protein
LVSLVLIKLLRYFLEIKSVIPEKIANINIRILRLFVKKVKKEVIKAAILNEKNIKVLGVIISRESNMIKRIKNI